MRRLIFGLGIALILSACARQPASPIASITKNSAQVLNRAVAVQGKVVRVEGERDMGNMLAGGSGQVYVYTIDDGTGEIQVVTANVPPRVGDKVHVAGTVRDVKFLGFSNLGLHIREEQRSGL